MHIAPTRLKFRCRFRKTGLSSGSLASSDLHAPLAASPRTIKGIRVLPSDSPAFSSSPTTPCHVILNIAKLSKNEKVPVLVINHTHVHCDLGGVGGLFICGACGSTATGTCSLGGSAAEFCGDDVCFLKWRLPRSQVTASPSMAIPTDSLALTSSKSPVPTTTAVKKRPVLCRPFNCKAYQP